MEILSFVLGIIDIMNSLIKQLTEIFGPPKFEDESKNPPAIVLNAVLLLSMGGLLIGSILNALTNSEPLVSQVVYVGVAISLIPYYILMHRGYIRVVSIGLVLSLFGTITATNVLLGGLDAPTISSYLVLITIAALLLGPAGGLVTGTVTIGTLALLYVFEEALPAPVQELSPFAVIVIQSVNMLLIAVFIIITTNTISRFLQRARLNGEALERSLQDLRQTTVSKNYVDNIIQSMSNLLIVLNRDGTIQTVNQTTLDTLGYTEEELIGKPYNSLLCDAENDFIDPDRELSTAQLLKTFSRRNVDEVFTTKSGQVIPVTVSSSALYDGNTVQGVVCVAQNITERREAERQLRYQAGLLESVFDAIIATSMDLTIQSWNRAAESMYGYKAEEVIGKKLTDVVPTSFDTSDTEQTIIKKKYIDRGYWQNEVLQQHRDGTPISVLSSISLLRDEKGKPIGTVTINHDITKRKEAEVELQKHADQLALLRAVDIELNSTLDVDAVLRIALEAAANIAGADAGFIALIDEQQRRIAHTYGRYHGVIAPSTPLGGVVGRVIRTHQPELVLNVQQDPDYNPDLPNSSALIALPLLSQECLLGVLNLETMYNGQFTTDTFDLLGILASRIAAAIDNARLYQVSQGRLHDLQVLFSQVSTLEQLKTEMLRMASHDLRNPIGIINGYTQLLQADLANRMTQEESDFLGQIASAAGRMDEIASNILSLERIHAAAQGEFSDTVDLAALVERAVKDHQSGAKDKRLRLRLLDDFDAPLLVKGDDQQLYEALANYLTNAIKYTPEDGEICVSAHRIGTVARISVTDTGYGIPNDQKERLFKPFSRAKSLETSEIEGIGLGLSLVKSIVQRHRGDVIFHSVYGEGSTFGFELPLVE